MDGTDIVEVIRSRCRRWYRIWVAYGRGIRLVDASEAITTAVEADRTFTGTSGLFAPVVWGVTTLVGNADREIAVEWDLGIPAIGTCLSDALDASSVERVQSGVHHGINYAGIQTDLI